MPARPCRVACDHASRPVASGSSSASPASTGTTAGAKIVARALRDAGHEVIYTGLHQTPEQIVETAIQEDADLIGLSVLSGAHMTLFRTLVELLAERDASDIVVFGGGIIPEEDIPVLEELGVAKVFTPGRHHRDHRLGRRALRRVGRPADVVARRCRPLTAQVDAARNASATR